VDTTKAITHLSLCSGYEGIGLGLRRVLPNLREIAYVEREGFVIANLVAKMEAGELDAAPVFTDVKTFPYREVRGCVDILSGGFPCQPFSAAGKRQATEDPRHLFPYIADGIRECQPRIVFLENVQGILSCKTADGEPVLQYVLRELEGMGYRATAGIFSAEEVGAPHQRKRVFILGVANSIGAGLEGHSGYEQAEGRQTTRQNRSTTASRLPPRWPARPGEPQYEWEEPRVVADSKDTDDSPGQYEGYEVRSQVKHRGGCVDSEQQDKCQAQSELGGAVDGTACGVDATANRVDRLRLLGNGVVNQTAAKAFVTLINRLV
jgi:DNA (cytosine-5)-methyltransferase 1